MEPRLQNGRIRRAYEVESLPKQGIQFFITGGIGKGGNNHGREFCLKETPF